MYILVHSFGYFAGYFGCFIDIPSSLWLFDIANWNTTIFINLLEPQLIIFYVKYPFSWAMAYIYIYVAFLYIHRHILEIDNQDRHLQKSAALRQLEFAPGPRMPFKPPGAEDFLGSLPVGFPYSWCLQTGGIGLSWLEPTWTSPWKSPFSRCQS